MTTFRIACCRSSNEAMKSLKLGAGQVLDGIDVTNQESINAVKNAIGDRHVDILINNAGILTVDNGKDVLSKVEDIRNQFEVNTLGPLLLTLSLRSNSCKSTCTNEYYTNFSRE